MVSLKLLALLLAPLSAIAHEAANSHGGQFVLTPSSGFSVGYKDSSPGIPLPTPLNMTPTFLDRHFAC
jgi:hypothetical protein